MLILKRATWIEILKSQFVLDIDTLISNVLLGLKNMKFGDVPLTKTFHFNVIKNMDALFSWYMIKKLQSFVLVTYNL